MDRTRFTESKTGELLRITTTDGPDWAFVPDPLPPNWEFSPTLWPLLAEAREQLARLDQIGRSVKNPSLLLQPLRKREALRSSSLEGTYATAKELLLYELDPREPASKADPANSWREVFNYDEALRYGYEKLNDKTADGLPLCNRLITGMHKLLLQDVRGNDKNAGEFRKRQVHLGSDRRYIPPPPGEPLERCMHQFEAFLHAEHHHHPLVTSYLVHYQFEAIHPFLDGNGRVGRSLLSLTTFKWGELYLPWLYMSAYFERYKDEYVDNMFRISTHGDWDRWIEFCLRGTVEQCRDAIRRCAQLTLLREEMHTRLGKLPRMHQIIEKLFFSPIFTAGNVAQWCTTSLPTARQDIEKLVKSGFVEHLEGQRPRSYYVPPIFAAAYHEDQDDPSQDVDAPVAPS